MTLLSMNLLRPSYECYYCMTSEHVAFVASLSYVHSTTGIIEKRTGPQNEVQFSMALCFPLAAYQSKVITFQCQYFKM